LLVYIVKHIRNAVKEILNILKLINFTEQLEPLSFIEITLSPLLMLVSCPRILGLSGKKENRKTVTKDK